MIFVIGFLSLRGAVPPSLEAGSLPWSGVFVHTGLITLHHFLKTLSSVPRLLIHLKEALKIGEKLFAVDSLNFLTIRN